MAVVQFNYATWAARYPEFSAVDQATATLYFNEATLYVDNTDVSPIPYNPPQDGTRAVILNMATAHIAMLAQLAKNAGGGGLVGRIETATEGSVTVTAKYADQSSEAQAWWTQTQYGAAAYRALGPYRIGFYRPGPPPQLNGLYFPPAGFRPAW